MNKATFIKRLSTAGIIKKDGAIAQRYGIALTRIMRGYDCHCYWLRSGSRYSLDDKDYNKYIEVCEALGLKYIKGNDAPRGGVDGNFVKILKSELKKVKNIEIKNIGYKKYVIL